MLQVNLLSLVSKARPADLLEKGSICTPDHINGLGSGGFQQEPKNTCQINQDNQGQLILDPPKMHIAAMKILNDRLRQT